MDKIAVTIYDLKAECHYAPLFYNHEADAVRFFASLVNDKSTLIGQYPADYQLFKVGVFDTSTAKIRNEDIPKFIVTGVSLVEKIN